MPFQVQWSITTAQGTTISRPQSGLGNNTYAFSRGTWESSLNRYGEPAFQWLRGNLGGLAAKGTSSGYTLDPGEIKIFGHDKDTSTATWNGDPNVNLSPGWGPGRQALMVADFGADELNADDTVEFIVSPDKGSQPVGGIRTYCNKWIGHRAAGAQSAGGNGGLALGGSSLPTSISFDPADTAYFPTIRSSQRLKVSQVATPQVERVIGNSFASPFIRPAGVTGAGVYHTGIGGSVPLLDHAYLANTALFDGWFCSSLHDGRLLPPGAPYQDKRSAVQVLTDFLERAPGDREARLLNTRIIPANRPEQAKARLLSGKNLHSEAIARVAAQVFLDGAFNVNSTRKDAWLAVLATSRDLAKRDPGGRRLTNAHLTPTGSSGLAAAAAALPTAQPSELEQWSGFRNLTDNQLETLAVRIVEEVKRRGPFLSLADFLNRRLSGNGNETLLGAVQAAIEQAGLNAAFKGGDRGLAAANFGGLLGSAVAAAGGGLARSTGIPGYLMQSDVLAPVANQLSPRGDTFRIRGYGAANDAKGLVIAEAWCEALVQRLPEYLDPLAQAEGDGWKVFCDTRWPAKTDYRRYLLLLPRKDGTIHPFVMPEQPPFR